MNHNFETLKTHIAAHPHSFDGGNSVLEMLYECYDECHPFDNEHIKAGFHDLYQSMNGMTLQDMDRIIYPLCTLCQEHKESGLMPGL